jgi:hypothetical protein
MATSSFPNTNPRIVSSAIVQAVAEEVVLERFPGIEDRPKVFYGYILGTAALIQPGLEALAKAYKQASATPCGRAAAQYFLSVMLETESEN